MAKISTMTQHVKSAGERTSITLASGTLDPSTNVVESDDGFESTITDNGTGDYTFKFSNSFTTAPRVWAAALDTTLKLYCTVYSITTSEVRVKIFDEGGTAQDPTSVDIFALGV